MSCLSEDTLLALCAGALQDAEHTEAMRHVNACASCRELLAQLVKAERSADSTESVGLWAHANTTRLARGTQVDRYVIVETLGAGGMGVVYAAYDPELDRKVAIKLVHPQLRASKQTEEARERMLREARAMARLSHPNVAQVFDVGLFEVQVYIAMELVTGTSLREWLAQGSAPWPETLDLFVQAGRGLEAAHAAGIIHRDFKPDNVLVEPSGRVRVTDFGLARALASEAPVASEASSRAHSNGPVTHTRPGATLGTPAYMSPEQRRGEPADERSDVYAFCVSLYEALCGARPQPGATAERTLGRLLDGHGKDQRVPRWLAAIVVAGLGPDSERRFASMTDLLAALTARRRRGRTVRLAAAGAALALFGFGGAWLLARAPTCPDPATLLAGAWDNAVHKQIAAAFRNSDKPFAEPALQTVTRVLSRHAEAWSQVRRQACETSQVRREQPEEVTAARLACLDQRLLELRATTGLLAQADAQVVSHAARVVYGLRSPRECAGPHLVERPAEPAEQAQRNAILSQLAESRAQLRAGKHDDSLKTAEAALTAAHELDDPIITAQARFRLAKAEQWAGHYDRAEKSLWQAIAAAEHARDDALRADAWSVLVAVIGAEQQDFTRVQPLVPLAEATVARLDDDRARRAALAYTRGHMAFNQGRYTEASELLASSLRALQSAPEPDEPAMISNLGLLGAATSRLQKYTAAEGYWKQALALARKLYGDEHPDMVSILTDMAVQAYARGRFEDGLALQRRSLRIAEATLGPKHPWMATNLTNVALGLTETERPEEALPYLERAHALYAETYGNDHPKVALSHGNLGCTLADTDAYDEARKHLSTALALPETALAANHPIRAAAWSCLGEVELDSERALQAVRAFSTALAMLEPSDHPDPTSLAQAQFGLAKALVATGGDAKRARSLAESARQGFTAAGGSHAERAAEIDAWLTTTHPDSQ